MLIRKSGWKLGMVAHAFDPRTWEIEAKEDEGEGEVEEKEEEEKEEGMKTLCYTYQVTNREGTMRQLLAALDQNLNNKKDAFGGKA